MGLRGLYLNGLVLSSSQVAEDLPRQSTTVHDGSLTMQKFFRFLKKEDGATAIEYGLIAALIAVAVIGAVTTLGANTAATFNEVSDELVAAPAS